MDAVSEKALIKTLLHNYCLDKNNQVFMKRFFAMWIDFAILALFLIAASALLPEEELPLILTIGVSFLYFVVFEGLTGATWGKSLCNIKVVDNVGNTPGLIKATIRFLIRIFEANPIFAGCIPAGIIIYLSKKGQSLADLVADTYVIPTGAHPKWEKSKQIQQK